MTAYTDAQLESYLHRINYQPPSPSANSYPDNGTNTTPLLHSVKATLHSHPLQTLTTLQRHHLASIPWGNSAIHYSQHHSISTHPAAVFEKLVVRRLDGYCMENTNLLYGVLRALGVSVFPAAGRVSTSVGDPAVKGRDVRFGALGHMVLIVTIDGERYMIDVGFGNNNPTSPLPLKERLAIPNTPPTSMRLIKEALPEAVDQSQKFWMYQVNYAPNPNPRGTEEEGKEEEEKWHTMYAFSETETLPQDFAMMNFHTSKLPSSWFTQRVVCVRQILEEFESGSESGGKELRPVGMYVMAGEEVKRRDAKGAEVVMRLKNEGDRVRALEKWFGIVLADHEVDGIRGLGSELV